ncbi:myristoyl :protein n-myristoyltransferase [Cyclospora cayetanensis]|uniref:Glycylpeptide N-tetradecanoyltransferase n=1 Tax=Cyclospora cayetanensis TaxID=88456 RepID=A0A1D3CZI6_9EIME|nr:myristoyl :protein n-myristoyltransferase [Cyclospora cayetanensis]
MPANSNTGERGMAHKDGLESKEADTPTTAASASPAGRQAVPAQPAAPVASIGPTAPSAAELAKMLRGKLIEFLTLHSSVIHRVQHPHVKTIFDDTSGQVVGRDEGPIDAAKTIDDVRKLYHLLALHYVEDDDNLFRFNYGREFLPWALDPPGAIKEWIIGLVGFITAIPTALQCNGKRVQVAEVNFLCVHKKLRSKRLAPVLIKEITRRVNLKGIWQAVYTAGKKEHIPPFVGLSMATLAGVVLPTPVAECRYWHRLLNPKKLVEVREEPATEGLRPMKESDTPQVHKLLMAYLRNFKLHPDFTEEEVRHWLTPRENVVYVYVRQHEGKITDLTSFYQLPSSVIGHPKHKEVKMQYFWCIGDSSQAAYSFYNVATTVPLKDLMQDALCLAKQKDFDVFNALDVMDNKTFVEDLKFGVGDGFLRYYLYNWRCPQVQHNDIGLVLL